MVGTGQRLNPGPQTRQFEVDISGTGFRYSGNKGPTLNRTHGSDGGPEYVVWCRPTYVLAIYYARKFDQVTD